MPNFTTTTRGVLRAAVTAGAVALTVAGASLGAAAPAEAFVRHGGFGGAHFGRAHFGGYGHGRRFGGYGFRRVVGYRGFGVRRFGYGIGAPFGGYGYSYRRCPIGSHLVYGLGCRLNVAYRYPVYGYRRIVRPLAYGYRSFGYGVRRVVRPAFVQRFGGYGHRYRVGRSFGGYGHRVGFGGHGFGHGGFGHGGFHRR